jgi:hypothetical protein
MKSNHKPANTTHHTKMTTKASNKICAALIAVAACTSLANPAAAGETAKITKEVAPAEEDHVHFLFDVTLASAYNTPRGMMVRANGLTIQPLFLSFWDVYKDDGFLNNITFVGGVWADFGTVQVSKQPPYGSNPKTNWTEIDPIAGLKFGLGKNTTLSATYIGFAEQILSIGMVHNLEVKLAYNDSGLWGGNFALNPYALFWWEIQNKTTAARVPQTVLGPSPFSGANPQPQSAFYFELGLSPSYTFKEFGNLKVEAPCRFLLPNSRFYGEYYGESSFLGLFEAGLRATLPLPKWSNRGYGNWSAYAGFKYQYYNDVNLYNLNTFLAPGRPTRDSWTFFSGVSVFF